jgi:uncharacterized protein YqgV (UPF0045/DUF77 family)
MKFVSVACLATSVAAGVIDPSVPVVERDVKVITGVLSDVGNRLDSLDANVKSFYTNVQPVQDASDAVVQTLQKGKTTVNAQPMLTLLEAAALTDPVQALQKKGQALLNDLKAKKSVIQNGRYCALVRKDTADINTYSNALITATVSKVPAGAQNLAKSLAD